MPFEVSEVMEVLAQISKEEDLRLTIAESVKGAATAGTCALVGGLVAGPPGIAIGAAAGGIFAAGVAKTFKPLATAIKELPAHKKEELTRKIEKIVMSLEPSDGIRVAISLMALVQGNHIIKSKIIETLVSYFGGESQVKIGSN